jgi:5-methylcytosine-specific restriction protein A
VCGPRVLGSRYTALGRGFIECHHLAPLAELAADRVSRLSDLALVCPNCHRMIHRRRPWLRLDRLSAILAGRPHT